MRCEFKLGDVVFQPDLSGALYVPDHKMLIVADLHFEKSTTLYERTGSTFPPFDTRETLRRLSEAVKLFDPLHLIFLGDTWHDKLGLFRMQDEDRISFQALISTRHSVFIAGNHDHDLHEMNGLTLSTDMKIGDVTLRHEPLADRNALQICGHLHPVAKLMQKGRVLRRRCFYVSEKQCVLPAMGALSGGLNCLDPVYEECMSSEGRRVILLGRSRLYQIGMKNLITE